MTKKRTQYCYPLRLRQPAKPAHLHRSSTALTPLAPAAEDTAPARGRSAGATPPPASRSTARSPRHVTAP